MDRSIQCSIACDWQVLGQGALETRYTMAPAHGWATFPPSALQCSCRSTPQTDTMFRQLHKIKKGDKVRLRNAMAKYGWYCTEKIDI
jgi:hypothetical protein